MNISITISSFERDLIRVDILCAIAGLRQQRNLALTGLNTTRAAILQAAIDVREEFLSKLNDKGDLRRV